MQIHGSIPYTELRRLGIAPSDIVDFSATVNPFPLPGQIQRLFNSDGISAYPDTDCFAAVKSLSDHHGIPAEWILVTAGTTETIFSLPLLYRRAIQFSPTYGDYEAAYSRHRHKMSRTIFPSSDDEFRKVVDKLKSESFHLLIICNPNNPDGRYLPIHKIQELCELFGHAAICIDESYQEMGENCDTVLPLLPRFRNLLVLKSLTKPFGIGGLRAGYAVSSGGVLTRIKKLLLPWGVSSLAQRIIPALFGHTPVFKRQWESILIEKKRVGELLSSIGVATLPGVCPFLLARFPNPAAIRRHLLEQHRLLVRDCASFGLSGLLRIMPSLPENNDVLLEALKHYKENEIE